MTEQWFGFVARRRHRRLLQRGRADAQRGEQIAIARTASLATGCA